MDAAKNNCWKRFVESDLQKNPWGIVYKLASGKLKKRSFLSSIPLNDGQPSTNLQETVDHILHSLLPDDTTPNTMDQDRLLSDFKAITHIPVNGVGSETLAESLDHHVSCISPKKAPGLDEITGRFVKLTYEHTRTFLLKLYQSCLNQGYFPTVWKRGKLCVLPKDLSKGLNDVKNLRPITLLPEYGKIFEKLIRDQIFREKETLHNPQQFGFVQGKSTIDALSSYISDISSAQFKYVSTIFVDFVKAFDHVWWPSIVNRMRKCGFSHALVAMIKSYLSNRSAIYKTNSCEAEKTLTMGCPQGSVLGPLLWNLVMDSLLEVDFPTSVKLIAYADDLAIVVRSNSRADLKEKMQTSINILETWAESQKLTVSSTKTKILINKSPPRCHNRDINVKLYSARLEVVQHFCYLGVTLDRSLNFQVHIGKVCDRAKHLIRTLAKKARPSWNLEISSAMTLIFKCAIVPIVSYASPIWRHKISTSKIKRKLAGLHGFCCRLLIKGYSSISRDASAVLAGLPPLDLLVEYNAVLNDIKRGKDSHFLNVPVIANEFPSFRHLKEYLQLLVGDLWQDRWDNSENGYITHQFCPEVGDGVLHQSTHVSSQIFSGHGNFRSHLYRIGKADSPNCSTCPGEDDDPIHRLFACPDFNQERAVLSQQFPVWPVSPQHFYRMVRIDSLSPFVREPA